MPELKESTRQKHFLNTRQQLYKKYRLEGYSKYTSARKAGYSHAYATQAKIIENHINMDYWLEREGLTDTCLAQHAKNGLNANKVISAKIIYGEGKEANEKTDDFIEVPDWNARHKYFDSILKLSGKLKEAILIDKSKHTHLTKITIQELKGKGEGELIEIFRRTIFQSNQG